MAEADSVAPEEAVVGALIGLAVGDALGLPWEGISRRRQARWAPTLERHRFFFGCGMVSDDTEHACMVAQAVAASGGDPAQFTRNLSWRLRFWLLRMPAGIGLATLKSILKLWVGFRPSRSGVFSAGNGPSMRSPILGVLYEHDVIRRRALVHCSSILTHRDGKAECAAQAVALAASMSCRKDVAIEAGDFFKACEAEQWEGGAEFYGLLDQVKRSLAAGESTGDFAIRALGLEKGVTGYSYHTVPIVLHAWLRHPEDYIAAVKEVIRCGGDTDTSAAIVGAITGARVGVEGIPVAWREGLIEWPCGEAWIRRVGARAAKSARQHRRTKPVPMNGAGVVLRNVFFAVVVLTHGFRRLLPPY